MVVLNIGSGNMNLPEAINIDLFAPEADVKAKATELPYESNSVDVVESHHLLEHLDVSEAYDALVEWHRVLKPGGRLRLSCPDVEMIMNAMKNMDYVNEPAIWKALMKFVYGDEREGMQHRHGYCKSYLNAILNDVGYKDVVIHRDSISRPTPSLMAVGVK